jgi:hypothetical protein
MKRAFVCALAIAGLACGGAGTAKTSGASGHGGSTVAVSGTGDTSPAPADAATAGPASAGGATSAGGGGAGGSAGTTASGGSAGTTASGGRTGTGAGGGAGSGDSDGGPGIVVTNPIVQDPIAAAAGLPQYYISNSGKDSNSGTSPDQAWATVTNIPKDTPAAVFFQRGGTFTAAGGAALGRDGPAAFNVPRGSVWASYGDGKYRPILSATEKTSGKPTGAVISPGGTDLVSGLSFTGQANFGILLQTDGNTVQDCEVDGNLAGSQIQLAFSVRGHHNVIVGNYIHDLHEVILDSGNVNTSGGAEAIVVNGTDQEIAYNTIVNCWCPNETLGGAEGGCLEIIARAPGEVVENVIFHHNYCERSVGLFEGDAGNFAGTAEKIQEHHAVIRNTTLAYNVDVDAMWLYLLQTVNTDMDHLVFEHNTLIHSSANTDIPQQGAAGFGNFYDTDGFVPSKSCSTAADCGSSYAICLGGGCYYQTKAQPGQITVRNNLFVVLAGATAATMKLPPGADDVIDNIFSPKTPSGITASAGKVTVVTDPGLVNTFRLGPSSPAIDKAGKDSVKTWADFDGNTIPCGSAPDVGASEYCQ